MISAVNSFAPDALFVGMTAPKQEKWVHEHRDRLNAPLICPVGAVFDFYAGTVRRSGEFWIRMGLEWLPRLIREPKRLWRRNFISTPLFLVLSRQGKDQNYCDACRTKKMGEGQLLITKFYHVFLNNLTSSSCLN